jgi:hypothetical protein
VTIDAHAAYSAEATLRQRRAEEKRWIAVAEGGRRTFLLGMAMTACGLDIGTSNTTFGSIAGDLPSLLELESGDTTIPSAIFFAREGVVLIGRREALHRGCETARQALGQNFP